MQFGAESRKYLVVTSCIVERVSVFSTLPPPHSLVVKPWE